MKKTIKPFLTINSIATLAVFFLLFFFLKPEALHLPRIPYLNDSGSGGDGLTGEITSILFLIGIIGIYYLYNLINLFLFIGKKHSKGIITAIFFILLMCLILAGMYNYLVEAPLYPTSKN